MPGCPARGQYEVNVTAKVTAHGPRGRVHGCSGCGRPSGGEVWGWTAVQGAVWEVGVGEPGLGAMWKLRAPLPALFGSGPASPSCSLAPMIFYVLAELYLFQFPLIYVHGQACTWMPLNPFRQCFSLSWLLFLSQVPPPPQSVKTKSAPR